jgi:glycosyltransferase involved in cell wall biosynthesis
MKLLCVCSALDIRLPYGCTSAWWQLLKGLHEAGHEVLATPYAGGAFASPWWRAFDNPCRLEGEAFSKARRWLGGAGSDAQDSLGATVTRAAIDKWIRPRWENHLAGILAAEPGVDAVILFSVPVNHLTGVPARLRERFDVPVLFYDGDVPASLPRFGGFASGFRIYDGAGLAEFDGVLCNSLEGAEDLRTLGARRVETVYWGADPDLFAPLAVEEDRDVFFYGYGSEYRENWIEALVAKPSHEMTEHAFHVAGSGFSVSLGAARLEPPVPFNAVRRACCRSRLNLCVNRSAHASVRASATMRPFELAALARCIVSSPYEGVEEWFEPGREILLVDSAEAAIETYQRLLSDESERRAIGEAARRRLLAEHTHRHRADQLAAFVASL